MKKLYFAILLALPLLSVGQVANPQLNNSTALQVLQGNYNPQNYAATEVIDHSDRIACEVNRLVSPDSLRSFLESLTAFGTRHTWSDTVSQTRGIGAARRWAMQKMQQISRRNENRLLTSYLTFDITNNSCGTLDGTKNVLGILPGADLSDPSVMLIEAHMDSRCAGRCDTACDAAGADDNGSGSALVLELARVMSRYTFDRTVVFMLTTGEEQGLLGATAFADMAVAQNIDVHAVQNNDIVGGVICGNTASPPGCGPPGSIDSTRLRVYANPLSVRFPAQGMARTIRLMYDEKLRNNVKVPMEVEIINQIDRTGRGGDHQPFTNLAPAMRFTSAHEHGNGNPNGTPNYVDHQHTVDDEIGLDRDGDGAIDTFFVDFNYMARNTVINAASAAYLASGPKTPEVDLEKTANGLRVKILEAYGSSTFRVGVKNRAGTDFDSIYRFSDSVFTIPAQQSGEFYMVAVAAVDQDGTTGLFTSDEQANATTSTAPAPVDMLDNDMDCGQLSMQETVFAPVAHNIILSQPSPNPTYGTTEFTVFIKEQGTQSTGQLVVTDQSGRRVAVRKLPLTEGENEFVYQHKAERGTYWVYVEWRGYRSQVRKVLVVN